MFNSRAKRCKSYPVIFPSWLGIGEHFDIVTLVVVDIYATVPAHTHNEPVIVNFNISNVQHLLVVRLAQHFQALSVVVVPDSTETVSATSNQTLAAVVKSRTRELILCMGVCVLEYFLTGLQVPNFDSLKKTQF
jgi:hypothetical protein